MNTLEMLGDRLCFVRPPFDQANVAAPADAFDAGLIILDYIQRIPKPSQNGQNYFLLRWKLVLTVLTRFPRSSESAVFSIVFCKDRVTPTGLEPVLPA